MRLKGNIHLKVLSWAFAQFVYLSCPGKKVPTVLMKIDVENSRVRVKTVHYTVAMMGINVDIGYLGGAEAIN
jgi:hypothetical protein